MASSAWQLPGARLTGADGKGARPDTWGPNAAVCVEASAAHTGPTRSSLSRGVRPFSPDARAERLAIRAHLRVRRHDGAHLTYFADF